MIHDDFLADMAYWTKWELLYKELYEKKLLGPAEYQKFLSTLDKEALKKDHFVIPDLFDSEDHFDESILGFSMAGSIVSAKHARYTPAFQHYHNYFEILYLAEGVAMHQVENGPWTELKKGDVIVLPDGVKHSVIVNTDDGCLINLMIKKSVFKELFYDVLIWDSLLSRFFWNALHDKKSPASYLHFQTGDDENIRSCIERIHVECWRQEKYYEKVLQSEVRVFLAHLMRKQELFYVADEDNQTLEIYRYIGDHYADCTLQSAANDFNYSTAHLSRIIKKETGKTFSEILTEYRLNMACRLLKESDLQIGQISEAVGYQNLTHFNHLFKKTFHMSPSFYRTATET